MPHAFDAGLHSLIRIPFVAEQAGNYSVEIGPRDSGIPATVRVTLTPSRAALPADRDRVAASDALARAEKLRRSHGNDSQRQALDAYDQAIVLAQTIGDTRLQQQAWLGKARVFLYGTGDYLAGLKAAQTAMAVEGKQDAQDPLEEVALQAFTWKVLSSGYYFLARYPEMIDATGHSLALYVQLGDLYWQGILEGNVASVYMETGDMQHALSSAERALAIARQLSDPWGIAFTEATIATIHQRRGEYQAAFDANEAALEEMRLQPYPDEEGQVWMGLAELYDELNDPERERDALNQSLPFLRRVRDTANESVALGDLAMLDLHEGYLHQADQPLQRSMQIAQSHQLHREQAIALLGEAELLAAERRTSRALQAIGSGLALAAQTGEVQTSALLLQEEGDLRARQGDASAALDAYRKAEASWSGVPNLKHAALARASMARVEFRSGELRAAHDDILLALDGFEASRGNIAGRSLRESFFASVHDFYDLAIEIDMTRGQGRAAAGSGYEAWQIAERARARSLMDAIRASRAFSAQDLPRSLIDRSAAVEKSVGEAQQTIARLRETGSDSAALRRATDRLHTLVLQAEDMEDKEREASSPSLLASGMHPPSLAAVRGSLLPPDTALLEYWVGGSHVDLWIVTATSMRGLRLCRSSALETAVQAYRKSLLAREDFPPNEDLAARQARIVGADREIDRQAAVLGRLLLPAQLPAAIHRLIVVPDGVLASVPFSALRLKSWQYVIREYEVVEEPSASIAIELLARRAPSRNQDRIAVFADPVYNQFDPRLARSGEKAASLRVASSRQGSSPVLRADAGVDLTQLPRLSASSLEASAIASIAGRDHVSLYLGFQATPEQAMRLDWRNFAIAHFATHALVDSAHPELSGIVLSTLNPQGAPEDGVLWLHDIYRTPMPVSLVVLSGCRTADGKSIPGEGISGLAQAFLSSGASGVIGALWSVDDAAANQMIPWFYRALLGQHLSASGALRSAQLKMLAMHRSPYDWAGYLVEGDWRAGTIPVAP